MVGSADHEVSSGPGSVEANPHQPCLCCNRIRGYIYTGPAYSERFHYLSGCLCPWCVADGSAAKQFGAEFTDTGTLDDVPKAVLEELAKRMPGFMAWQQERWLCCCDDFGANQKLTSSARIELTTQKAARATWHGGGRDLRHPRHRCVNL